MKLLRIFIIGLLLLTPGIVFAGEPNPDTIDVVNAFIDEVREQVDNIVTDEGTTISDMRSIVSRALYFILLFFAVVNFIINGLNVSTVNAFLMGFLYAFLTETYTIWTAGIYNFFDVGGLAIQEFVVGTQDRFFLSKYFTHLWNRVSFEELNVLDSVNKLVQIAVLWLLGSILQLVVRIAEIWAIWGSQLMILIGPLFLPFIIHPSTRPLFDKWLQLLVGFAVYGFIVRCIGILFAIFTASFLGEAGFTQTVDGPITFYSNTAQIYSFFLHLVISILMFLSAGKISSSLSGGIGESGASNKLISAGGKAGRAAVARIAKLVV